MLSLVQWEAGCCKAVCKGRAARAAGLASARALAYSSYALLPSMVRGCEVWAALDTLQRMVQLVALVCACISVAAQHSRVVRAVPRAMVGRPACLVLITAALHWLREDNATGK